MAVTTFHDFSPARLDREWDGATAEKRGFSGAVCSISVAICESIQPGG
jgi:hypothetical protein